MKIDAAMKLPPDALRMYRRFHGKNPIKVTTIAAAPGLPSLLIYLGEAHTTDYLSSKRNGGGTGKTEHFTHRHAKGTGLYTDISGKNLYILGPRLKITRAGIEG